MAALSASFDPTEYVQKQRVTKTTPPKPAYNPLQFIQIKPCNLYQSAQDQLRKAEEVKKTKITKKEEAEDWQGVSVALVYNIPRTFPKLHLKLQSALFILNNSCRYLVFDMSRIIMYSVHVLWSVII